MQDFDLIGKGLAWRIEDGHRFLVETDPWSWSGREHLLSHSLQNFMENRGITFLCPIEDFFLTSVRCQGWMGGEVLGLPLDMMNEWNRYLWGLKLAHIRLFD